MFDHKFVEYFYRRVNYMFYSYNITPQLKVNFLFNFIQFFECQKSYPKKIFTQNLINPKTCVLKVVELLFSCSQSRGYRFSWRCAASFVWLTRRQPITNQLQAELQVYTSLQVEYQQLKNSRQPSIYRFNQQISFCEMLRFTVCF